MAFADQAGLATWWVPAGYVALAATAISAVALLLLHVLSPEFGPSWRMVSEYANGRHGWLLACVFVFWALSSLALAAGLWPLWATTLGKVGLIFLLLAALGQTMGAVFDINHKLHGPAAMIGIPSLCVAAVVLTMAMARHGGIGAPPMWTAHLPWIAFVLMLATLMLLFSALKAAGVDMSAQTGPLDQLPAGVTGYVGWANRLLFAASYLWAALAALALIRAQP